MSTLSKPSNTDGSVAIQVEISIGELIDRITILEIKAQEITDPTKLVHVSAELESLGKALSRVVDSENVLGTYIDQLRTINRMIWLAEDNIRECERKKNFGCDFIELSRSIYLNNDKRAETKRFINQVFNSKWVEEKQYTRS